MNLANNNHLNIYGHSAEKYCLLAPEQVKNLSCIYLFVFFVCYKMQFWDYEPKFNISLEKNETQG